MGWSGEDPEKIAWDGDEKCKYCWTWGGVETTRKIAWGENEDDLTSDRVEKTWRKSTEVMRTTRGEVKKTW